MIDDDHNDEALFADLAAGLNDDADTAAAATAAIQPIGPALRDAGVYLLNEMVLRPRAGQERFCAVVDPDEADAVNALPQDAGVYLFVTPGHFHAYPGGASSIMYIGKGAGRSGIRGRIKQHVHCLWHLAQGADDRFFPVYEWASTYKPLIAYATTRDDPKELEYELLRTFAQAFSVVPVANSQSAW